MGQHTLAECLGPKSSGPKIRRDINTPDVSGVQWVQNRVRSTIPLPRITLTNGSRLTMIWPTLIGLTILLSWCNCADTELTLFGFDGTLPVHIRISLLRKRAVVDAIRRMGQLLVTQ